ncbi:hypothetical protein [Streptomyces sp. NPDC057460]|uniref:hypothetical protein n=1 Tax=Streptomyces sp. NPDC057460 TaxID=3346141 RepID=UPI0036BDFD03
MRQVHFCDCSGPSYIEHDRTGKAAKAWPACPGRAGTVEEPTGAGEVFCPPEANYVSIPAISSSGADDTTGLGMAARAS